MSLSAQLTVVKRFMLSSGSIIVPSNGYSMYPKIRPKDECLFTPAKEEQLNAGDILLFGDEDGYLIGHRLIHIKENQSSRLYICKGDTNIYPDEPIVFDQIVGRLSCIERRTRRARISKISSTDRGMIIWGQAIMRFPLLSFLLRKWVHAFFVFPTKQDNTGAVP